MNLRDMARDQQCKIRIPGFCSGRTDTTVLCHIKRGWCGTLKPPDLCGVHGCFECHAVYDGRQESEYSRTELDAMMLRALCEQLRWYLDRGIVQIKGARS
jgi:hypothetical protein